MRKPKPKPCKHPGCDFSAWDHKIMHGRGETCADWLDQRKRGREFCHRLRCNADALIDGKPRPYPDLLSPYRTPDPKAEEDFWNA